MKTSVKLVRDFCKSDPEEHAAYLAAGHEDYDIEYAPIQLQPLLLVAKLHEEAEEIRGDLTNPEEYGDLLQVLCSLAGIHGISFDQIEKARRIKHANKGTFLLGKVMFKPMKPPLKSTETEGTPGATYFHLGADAE